MMTVLDCTGCGMCCTRMRTPPFVPDFDDPESCEFEALRRSHPELAARIRDRAMELTADSEGPCLWFDPDTRRCQHYDIRPEICRDFEVGGVGCLGWQESRPKRNG